MVAGLLAACLLASSPARAWFDDQHHLVDYSAHTMEGGEWRLGLWNLGFAPTDWLTLDTYTWPWLLRVSNASVKVRLWQSPDWTVSAKAGYFYLDVQNLNEESSPATFHVIPVEAAVSCRLAPDWQLNGALVYTPMVIKGSYDESDLEGAAGQSNIQATLAVEWRLSRSFLLFVRSRHLLHMDVSGRMDFTVQLDEYTTAETHASVGADDVIGLGFPQTFQVVPGIAYSGRVFNAELGLGWGNFNLPGVNFILPGKIPVPQLDLYWRW